MQSKHFESGSQAVRCGKRGFVSRLRNALCTLAWLTALVPPWSSCQAAPADDIVLLQVLPLTGATWTTGQRVLAGATAAVGRENAAGGVLGRRLRLVSVDDEGQANQTSAKLQEALRGSETLAIINCVDDLACRAARQVGEAAGVPLFGPLSGARLASTGRDPRVFQLRADYRREAAALLKQLQSVGVRRAAILSDGTDGAERESVISTLLSNAGIQTNVVRMEANVEGAAIALKTLSRSDSQVLIFTLGPGAIGALAAVANTVGVTLPSTLVAFGSPGITELAKMFRQQAFGFSSPVPYPETSSLKLARELLDDSEQFSSPEAITFEGLEAYLNVRALAEVLRRQPRVNLKDADWQAATVALDIGGFKLDLGRSLQPASDWVRVGVRTRDGLLRH